MDANTWKANASSDWSDPANWVDGHVPLPDERVLVHVPDHQPLVWNRPKLTVRSIEFHGPVTLQNPDLTVPEGIAVHGALRWSGGRIANATIQVKDGGSVRLLGGATMDRLRIVGSVEAAEYDTVRLSGGLDLTGGRLRIPGGRLEILETQTIEGGTVELLGSFAWSYLVIPAQQTLTLSATTLVRGGPGWIQGDGTLRNLGTLRADVEGQAFRVWPAVYVNEGTAVAVGGGILETR